MYRQRTFCQFFFSSDTRKLTDICAPQHAPRQRTRLPVCGRLLSADYKVTNRCITLISPQSKHPAPGPGLISLQEKSLQC